MSIWANKNGDKSAIKNMIRTKLHRIYRRIVVNACVEYREEMFIGVGDIQTDNIFKYFLNLRKQNWWKVCHLEFDPDKTSQDSLEDCNKCMCKVSKKIFIGVRDIHRDGQFFLKYFNLGRTDGNTDRRSLNHYPPQKKCF